MRKPNRISNFVLDYVGAIAPTIFCDLCRIKIENVIIVVKNITYAYRANVPVRGRLFVAPESVIVNLWKTAKTML